jgi:hypothetical protein
MLSHHINVNVLAREILEDAHIHPEKYPNLTGRVSGYAVLQPTDTSREEVHGSNDARLRHRRSESTKSSRLLARWMRKCSTKTMDDTGSGSVYSLETFATTDGPGIRANVFLQGCAKRVCSAATPKLRMCNPDQHPEFAMSADVLRRYSKRQASSPQSVTTLSPAGTVASAQLCRGSLRASPRALTSRALILLYGSGRVEKRSYRTRTTSCCASSKAWTKLGVQGTSIQPSTCRGPILHGTSVITMLTTTSLRYDSGRIDDTDAELSG